MSFPSFLCNIFLLCAVQLTIVIRFASYLACGLDGRHGKGHTSFWGKGFCYIDQLHFRLEFCRGVAAWLGFRLLIDMALTPSTPLNTAR